MFGSGFCNGCNGCSAADFVTDVTDVTDEGRNIIASLSFERSP